MSDDGNTILIGAPDSGRAAVFTRDPKASFPTTAVATPAKLFDNTLYKRTELKTEVQGRRLQGAATGN
jgi:hypothetical protein